MYAAKADVRLPPARMPGSLVDDGQVVGHWQHSGPRRELSLEEWTSLQPPAQQEWDRFRAWYAEVDRS